ncbi:sensor histidine kinase [Paenibacillus thalictri]|nr:ATP-binding protein [Paenibacillus thalictri]
MYETAEFLLMIASFFLISIMFIFVYRFRKQRGIRWLLGLMACRLVYVCSVILEKSVPTLAEKLFFRNVYQTAVNMMVPFIILFVLEWVFRDRPLRMRWKMALLTAFVLWSVQMWLPADWNLIYHTVEQADGYLLITRTGYSLAFSMLCFMLIAGCIYLLAQYIRNSDNELRKPGLWVLALASILFVLEILKFVSPQWASWLLPMTVYCSFSGSLMLIIVLRYKLFSLVPLARNFALDTIQESIVIANSAGRIIDANKQASLWFSRLGMAELTGKRLAEVLWQWPDWHALCGNMQQGSVSAEVWLDGERRVYQVNVYPIRAMGQEKQGSLSLLIDRTEHQRHLEQIADLNQLKDQLITIVSHDIRGPLALQYQLVELLEEERARFSPEHQEILAQLGSQIRNTLSMSTNVLEWFRSQREEMGLRPMSLNVADIMEECLHLLRIHAETKQVRLTHTVVDGLWVYADREAIGLIIRNLLSNAIKFTEPGGLVQLDAGLTEEGNVLISVRDNGIGIDPERLRMLLEDQQLRTAMGTAGEKGAGLGLFVTRLFIERSGGSFRAESRKGEGSVFQFTMKGGQRLERDSG